MSSGSIHLGNYATVSFSGGGMKVTGGTLEVDDKETESLLADGKSTDPLEFDGGTLQFNEASGPASFNYGIFAVSGYVNFHGMAIDMNIDGSKSNTNNMQQNGDIIYDTDSTAHVDITTASKLYLTNYTNKGMNVNPGLKWYLLQLAGSNTYTGGGPGNGALIGTTISTGSGANALYVKS